jgi:RNA polymerase sigma-70 factor (ECF subfamily)
MRDSDAYLIRKAKSGSRAALGALVDRHWRFVWQTAYAVAGRREFADDIAQETFMRAISSLSSFDEARPLRPWLAKIAVNRAIDLRRREMRLLPPEAEDRNTTDVYEEIASHAHVIDAVKGLADERRLVIVLHYWLGLTVDEIGEVLETPRGTVASRLGRALNDLRNDLEASHVA